jgi:hypothetical protein
VAAAAAPAAAQAPEAAAPPTPPTALSSAHGAIEAETQVRMLFMFFSVLRPLQKIGVCCRPTPGDVWAALCANIVHLLLLRCWMICR